MGSGIFTLVWPTTSSPGRISPARGLAECAAGGMPHRRVVNGEMTSAAGSFTLDPAHRRHSAKGLPWVVRVCKHTDVHEVSVFPLTYV